jgi:hypothetical protein
MVSCSQVKTTRELGDTSVEPNWLYAPSSGCVEYELCATGEGKTEAESDLKARSSLASIFKSGINAELNLSKESVDQELLSRIQETVTENVNMKTELILKGSYIKERYPRKQSIYTLAAIDKRKSARMLTREIESIDSEIMTLYRKRNRVYLKKLLSLFSTREILNERLVILKSKGIHLGLTKGAILKLKEQSDYSELIYLNFSTKTPEFIQDKISENFTQIGFNIVERNKATYIIDINFSVKNEFINVEGFYKYSFGLTLVSHKYGNKLGVVVVKKIANGRSLTDALLKVREKLISDFGNKIEGLELN